MYVNVTNDHSVIDSVHNDSSNLHITATRYIISLTTIRRIFHLSYFHSSSINMILFYCYQFVIIQR